MNHYDEALIDDVRPGMVSISIGQFPSVDALDAYLHEQYDDDDAPMSPFAAAWGFGWYDHDYLEAEWWGAEALPVDTLLARHAWSSSYVAGASAAARTQGIGGATTTILLFDFAYNGSASGTGPDVQLLGAFPYDTAAPTAAELGDEGQ